MNRFALGALGAALVIPATLVTVAALVPAVSEVGRTLRNETPPFSEAVVARAIEVAMATHVPLAGAMVAGAVLLLTAAVLVALGCVELKKRYPHLLFPVSAFFLVTGAVGSLAGSALLAFAAAAGDGRLFSTGGAVLSIGALLTPMGWILLGGGLILRRKTIGDGGDVGRQNLAMATGVFLVFLVFSLVPILSFLSFLSVAGIVLLALLFWNLRKAPLAPSPDAKPS